MPVCVDVRYNALILRGLASVDMLAVAFSPRPAPVKAVTVKIYAVPSPPWRERGSGSLPWHFRSLSWC